MAGKRNILPAMHEKGLEVYFRDINRYDLLSRDEEVALARRVRAGDEEALQELVRANLRFVVSVAKRYINQGLMLSDLINEGIAGAVREGEVTYDLAWTAGIGASLYLGNRIVNDIGPWPHWSPGLQGGS